MNETPKCSICDWTNTGLWNLGEFGEPKYVCQGCGKRLLEENARLREACSFALKYHRMQEAKGQDGFPSQLTHALEQALSTPEVKR